MIPQKLLVSRRETIIHQASSRFTYAIIVMLKLRKSTTKSAYFMDRIANPFLELETLEA
ncbi:MAG: hypothetical protein KAR17_22995 [Cyclobacteriaceae bacterium]|nr:hypothetical protein [Cyclobacteriaceae bacterium]